VFINLASSELCRVLKDPKRNGGKTPEQLIKHVAEDKLVLWGWEPGASARRCPCLTRNSLARSRSGFREACPALRVRPCVPNGSRLD